MKQIMAVLVLITLFTSCVPFVPGKLIVKQDEFNNITTYTTYAWKMKNSSAFEDAFVGGVLEELSVEPMLVKSEDLKLKSINFQYRGVVLLGLNEIILLIDGEKWNFEMEAERTSGSRGFVEWIKLDFTEEFLKNIYEAETVKVRFQGSTGKLDCEMKKEVRDGIKEFFSKVDNYKKSNKEEKEESNRYYPEF